MSSHDPHRKKLDGQNRKIAVVDDDAAVRDSLRFLLETAGFPVATYASACQFLATIRTEWPGCLILDHNMPRVTGLELLAELRRRDFSAPIILMTAAPSAALHHRAAELGVGLVLAKPLMGDDLLGFVGCTLGS